MAVTIRARSFSPSPAGEWLFALVFWTAGSAIIALAVGWIPSRPGSFEAPHWLVATAGLSFLAGGFAPFAAHWGPNSWASRSVGAALLWPLTVIFNWIAFGPGPRHFTGGLAIAGSAVSQGTVSDSAGRMVFGIAAVALDLMVVAVAVRWMRIKTEESES
jgi:hypothetical protein